MTIHPPTLADLEKVAEWREDCRETLRTPYMVSKGQQASYLAHIEASYDMRMWSFYREAKDVKGGDWLTGISAFGGLQDIQWENGLAEISLIVDPALRGKGIGKECVEIILHEAFANMRLHQVWGEVYKCGAWEFWVKALAAWDRGTFSTDLKDRKRWSGEFHDSLYFAFMEP